MCYFFKIYNEKVFWDIYYFFFLKNIMDIPFIYKIVLNICCSDIFFDKFKMKNFYINIFDIFSQKPLFIKCKKSISEFNIKKNENISLKVTLRKFKMFDFFYKFLVISVPMIKNFSGFSKNFDKFGNYNFGLSNLNIFPEFNNLMNFNKGLNFSIIFRKSSPEKSFFFLKKLNFPFLNV